MLRDHPILNALLWAAIGALAATLAFVAYWALSPAAVRNDAALDEQARNGHR